MHYSYLYKEIMGCYYIQTGQILTTSLTQMWIEYFEEIEWSTKCQQSEGLNFIT